METFVFTKINPGKPNKEVFWMKMVVSTLLQNIKYISTSFYQIKRDHDSWSNMKIVLAYLPLEIQGTYYIIQHALKSNLLSMRNIVND